MNERSQRAYRRTGRRPFRGRGLPRSHAPERGGTGTRPREEHHTRPSAARLGLRPVPGAGGEFELVHPRCVEERRDDVEDALEMWRGGEPEEARDALRFALQGFPANLWIHVALGRLALEVARDPALARGHFGYAFELARRAIPEPPPGRIPASRPANRPLYDAIEGLLACAEAQGRRADVDELRTLSARWRGGPGS